MTNNIKTFKELKKLFKDTQWLTIKFSKDEISNQFQKGTMEKWFEQPDKTKEEFYLKKYKLDQRIDKKTQSDVYRLRLLAIKDRYYSDSLYNNKLKAVENSKSYTIYEVVGGTGGRLWSKFVPTETKFWVDNYTNQLLYVSYKREDIWFNNFFRNKIDSSVSNNYDELYKEKTFHLAYVQSVYRIVTAKGLDYEDAEERAEKENPELKFKLGRKNYKWEHVGRVKVDKLPNGDFDMNDLIYR
jgi:hypothetical protein